MENIKDLKLIIGPLNTKQWKEVTSWCNENSTDIKFPTPSWITKGYIKYTYTSTSHSETEIVYKEKEFETYETLTYQQWYDRFIKKEELPRKWKVKISNYKLIEDYLITKYGKIESWFKSNDDFNLFSDEDIPFCPPSYASVADNFDYTEISFDQFQRLVLKDVKQNKEEVMSKSSFSIEGTLALKRAFVEEVNIPKSDYWVDKNHICNSEFEGKLGTCYSKQNIHFTLPTDWNKAVKFVKEYFKEEPKFKVGQWIVPLQDCDLYTYHARRNNRPYQIYKIFDSGTIAVYNEYGKEDANGKMKPDEARLATPEEILNTLVKESGFKVGDNIESINACSTIKGVIKKFYLDKYITKQEDTLFLYITLQDGNSYVTTNWYGEPQFKLYNPTKTLVLGDKKIKVEISRKNIVADGKTMRVAELYRILGAMSTTTVLDGTSWTVSYPNVQIGCTTLSLDEVKLIKKTYEELND